MAQKVAAFRSAQSRRPEQVRHALQFLIVLLKTDPIVWRRVHVPGEYTFWDLHVAIQDAMGWQDYHLHEFRVVDEPAGKIEHLGIPDPTFPDERPCTPDWQVPLSKYYTWESLDDAVATRYLYDFGDDWQHLVLFEDIVPAGTRRLPRCVGGARACPPEDCGGVHGFEAFLAALADPKHREHAQLVEWSGGNYDPETFNPSRVRFDDPKKRWKKAFRE